MYYPHADDEIVAMGYANYYNQTEENETMVTVRENAFRSYMFENYVKHLDKETLVEMLELNVATEVLVDMAQLIYDLPFAMNGSQVELLDASDLLEAHSGQDMELPECDECDEDDDYDIVTGDDDDWFDEEFAPYDDLDDSADEGEQ